MTSENVDDPLRRVPWAAIIGEAVTASAFGLLALFLPFGSWVTWPRLLVSWHFGVAIVGAVALAWAIYRRGPRALKAAVVLAAYVGLPGLLFLGQALGEIRAASDGRAMALTYAVWGLGALGQAAVLFSCLRRLTPIQPLGTGRVERRDAP